MFCTQCGEKIKENSNYCKNCGASQKQDEDKKIDLPPLKEKEDKKIETPINELVGFIQEKASKELDFSSKESVKKFTQSLNKEFDDLRKKKVEPVTDEKKINNREQFKLGKSFLVILVTLLIITFILYWIIGYFDENFLEGLLNLLFLNLFLAIAINFIYQVIEKLIKSKFKITNSTKRDFLNYGIFLILIGVVMSVSIPWFGSIIGFIGIISITKSLLTKN